MEGGLWFTLLYQPFFNALIYIYNTTANLNLGWAVVWLTIFLRLALLPFSVLSERSSLRHQQLEEEALASAASFKHDPVAQKEEFRRIMKKHKVSPWARVITLAAQFILFLVLYQVFVRGISGERVMRILYSFVDFPGKINTNFYGFDIGQTHSLFWAGLAAGYLFLSTLVHHRLQKVWEKRDMFFVIFFPLSVFAILWYLPLVKSLFILTTLLFSDIFSLAHGLFAGGKKQEGHH